MEKAASLVTCLTLLAVLWFLPGGAYAVDVASFCLCDSSVAMGNGVVLPVADSVSARTDSIADGNARTLATMAMPADTSALKAIADSASISSRAAKKVKKQFKPDPARALWLSLVLPGAGQIYNRKYWKLPFVYGGFLGCTYALMWNQQMYKDYSQAYLDIMDNDPNTKSYNEMLPPGYDITGREEQYKNIFKNKKNFYRRYRDLSAFCFIGVYLLSVIDAYVDAQLSEFDISPDLSMRVSPAVIGSSPFDGNKGKAVGLGCCLNF